MESLTEHDIADMILKPSTDSVNVAGVSLAVAQYGEALRNLGQ